SCLLSFSVFFSVVGHSSSLPFLLFLFFSSFSSSRSSSAAFLKRRKEKIGKEGRCRE
ncbi:hypothetical protein CSUI_004887, partial [Cystoisospora suis]